MKNLTEGNIRKNFFSFALPLVLSGVLSQAYNVIDTVIAGKFLGDTGLAAIGATSALTTIVSSLGWGYSTGSGVYIARLFGARDYAKIRNAVVTVFAVMAFVFFVICTPLVVFYKPVFAFLNIDKSISEETCRYYSIYLGGLFFVVLNHLGLSIMNALGESTFPLFMSIVSAVINVSGNIISVKYLNMGAAGLALSSVLAGFAADICYVFKVCSCFEKLGVKGRVKIEKEHIVRSAPYNVPNSAQQVIMYLSSFLISPLVNSLGTAATAGYTVVLKVYDVCSAMFFSSSKTIANYTAQCVGAGKGEQHIKKGLRVGILQNIVFTMPAVIVCVIFPREICGIFFRSNADPVAVEYAVTFAKYFVPFLFFLLICNSYHALYRGVKAMRYLFLCTFFSTLVRVVATVALMPKFAMNGIYAGWVVSWVAEAILVFVIYKRGKWISQIEQ